MTKPLPFTKAALKRAITVAREQGLRVLGIRPDGTLLIGERADVALDDNAEAKDANVVAFERIAKLRARP